MWMIEYRDIGWWYWLVTAVLLTLGISGWEIGYWCAIALTSLQILHFVFREHSLVAFAVQVRFFYLLLLLLALPKPMQWLFWIPMIGTWAQVLLGYCAMARCVSLLPWNRRSPLSWSLVKQTFLSRPQRGNVMQGFAARR